MKVLFAAAVAVMGLLVACGSSSSPSPSPSPTSAPSASAQPSATGISSATPSASAEAGTNTLTFSGNVSASGAVAVSGTFTTTTQVGASSCADLATTGDKSSSNDLHFWPLPPSNTTPIGGHSVQLGGLEFFANGPGTFNIDGSTRSSGPTLNANALIVDNANHGLSDSTRATVVINADGSGKFTFTNLVGSGSSATESGTISWTCSGP